jgi:hypothetical protein
MHLCNHEFRWLHPIYALANRCPYQSASPSDRQHHLSGVHPLRSQKLQQIPDRRPGGEPPGHSPPIQQPERQLDAPPGPLPARHASVPPADVSTLSALAGGRAARCCARLDLRLGGRDLPGERIPRA